MAIPFLYITQNKFGFKTTRIFSTVALLNRTSLWSYNDTFFPSPSINKSDSLSPGVSLSLPLSRLGKCSFQVYTDVRYKITPLGPSRICFGLEIFSKATYIFGQFFKRYILTHLSPVLFSPQMRLASASSRGIGN